MTPLALFLITPANVHNDNHERIPELFEQAGWHVTRAPHDALTWAGGEICCMGKSVNRYQLIWPIGFGPHNTFLDRNELLHHIDQSRLITAAAAYTHLHGKSAWLDFAPPTYISHDPEVLCQVFNDHPGTWVLKPLAGSFGADVHRIADAEQLRRIFDDPEIQRRSNYWMLQQFIEEIAQGETRTLICADQVIGSYLRIPVDGLHANLAAQARTETVALDTAEQRLIEQVRDNLRRSGVGFAAIDTVGGYVMEVNIANPGGLGTLSDLYGPEIPARFIAAINALDPTAL